MTGLVRQTYNQNVGLSLLYLLGTLGLQLHLWENFSQIQRKSGDAEVDWTMFSASIVHVGVWNRGHRGSDARTRWLRPKVGDAEEGVLLVRVELLSS